MLIDEVEAIWAAIADGRRLVAVRGQARSGWKHARQAWGFAAADRPVRRLGFWHVCIRSCCRAVDCGLKHTVTA